MSKFSNLFKKNKGKSEAEAIQSDEFVTTNSNSLQTMTKEELIDIIFRYDTELKSIYQSAEENKTLLDENTRLTKELKELSASFSALEVNAEKQGSELADRNSVYESKSAEIDLLKSQIVQKDGMIQQYVAQLKGQLSEYGNEGDSEAKILNQALQAENDRRVLKIKNLKSDIAQLKTNLESLSQQKSEQEMNCYKAQIEYEALQRDVVSLKFTKEASETEAVRLKESINEKAQQYHRKQIKCESLKTKLREMTEKHTNVANDLEKIQNKHSVELLKAREDADKEIRYRMELHNEKMTYITKELEDKTKQLDFVTSQLRDSNLSSSEVAQEQKGKDAEITRLTSELNEAGIKIVGIESTLRQSQESLESAKIRKNTLKQEVTELLSKAQERVEPTPRSTRSGPVLAGAKATDQDLKVLDVLRRHFETLYKHLMKIMMTAQTSKISNEKMAYLIDTEEFSTFERRLNDIVEASHDACENPGALLSQKPPDTPSGGWRAKVSSAMNKFSAKGIMKLGCMSSEEPDKAGNILESRSAQRRVKRPKDSRSEHNLN